MVKKIRLSLEENDYAKGLMVWVLNSPYREYKLVSLLNKLLETPFHHKKYYEYFDIRSSRSYLYPIYTHSLGKSWLIGNRTEEVYLLPEFKPYNIVLCFLADEEVMKTMDKMKNADFITHIQKVKTENYPGAMEMIQKILNDVEN